MSPRPPHDRIGTVVRCGPGWLPVARSARGIVSVELPVSSRREALAILRDARVVMTNDDEMLSALAGELSAYFDAERVTFSVPLDLSGVTAFRRRVLRAVANIEYGELASYGDIARAVGAPKAARAVGQAVGSNPLPLLVPCHRVVGSDGSLTGFGAGLAWKAALLALERDGRVISRPPAPGSSDIHQGSAAARSVSVL